MPVYPSAFSRSSSAAKVKARMLSTRSSLAGLDRHRALAVGPITRDAGMPGGVAVAAAGRARRAQADLFSVARYKQRVAALYDELR